MSEVSRTNRTASLGTPAGASHRLLFLDIRAQGSAVGQVADDLGWHVKGIGHDSSTGPNRNGASGPVMQLERHR